MNTYHIKIQSESFKIITEHKKKLFEGLQSEVDKKLQTVQSSNSGISMNKALILTCLQLAFDKHQLKQLLDKNINQLEAQTKSLLKEIGVSSSKMSFE